MKPVSFLRNTWRKREQKVADSNDETQIYRPARLVPMTPLSADEHPPKASLPVLTLGVSVTPLQDGLSNWLDHSEVRRDIKGVERSYCTTHDSQPQHNRSIARKDSSSTIRDLTLHSGHGAPPNVSHGPPYNAVHGAPSLSMRASVSSFTSVSDNSSLRRSHRPPKITVYPPVRHQPAINTSSPVSNPRSPTRVKFATPLEVTSASSSESRPGHHHHIPSSKSPSSLRSGPHSHRIRQAHYIPDQESPATTDSMYRGENPALSRPSRGTKTVHAMLDLSTKPKPRSLYHSTGSTPHLPYVEPYSPSPSRLDVHPRPSFVHSESLADPLALFPSPPPLIIRKKVPKPLILRPTPSIAPLPPSPCFSSRDSTPPTTPITPRAHMSGAYLKSISPTSSLKQSPGRPLNNIPPPLFSPPTSPLPTPPTSHNSLPRSPDHGNLSGTRPLRIAKSTSQLRNDAPSPLATHRFTSSEPISELPHDPIRVRRRVLSRPEASPTEGQKFYPDSKDAAAPMDGHVQWGYAL
ncbi:hypothetical protein BDQ12DRAFT_189931 [Crucibulum laeve]|uniref:Uncharacterized protein n=1 Tax=Crucibulum laeve TaxID=68775 RepID=A0A5C3MDZ6_9AGAR|nr:hypothetical protein BDQ12DRAFT_189931 [Crucibulum laeve]